MHIYAHVDIFMYTRSNYFVMFFTSTSHGEKVTFDAES